MLARARTTSWAFVLALVSTSASAQSASFFVRCLPLWRAHKALPASTAKALRRPTQAELEKIIAVASDEQDFGGPSGSYAQKMSQGVLEAKPEPGNFRATLDRLWNVRLDVLNDDIAVAKAKGLKTTGLFEQQLKYMSKDPSSVASQRMNGTQVVDRILTDATEDNRYSALFRAYEARDVGVDIAWNPGVEFQTKLGLSQGPLLVESRGAFAFRIKNASDVDMPKILDHLSKLWDQALAEPDPRKSVALIADFEWLFYAANPTARSGAALGDALSLSLQIEKGLPLRAEFEHQDWQALTRTPQEYRDFRLKQFELATKAAASVTH